MAAWVWTSPGSGPVVAHAGWRTDSAAAVEVVMRSRGRWRTPEPLRRARSPAREARSAARAIR
ncbi:MAG: hypothetical protein M9942_09105 [Microthrixaceae bacterium]|nr:hypothetical protein [Microthrixaceae bacterium]MCO5318581.1 hypothetical protein [Microthrixaceae bacterium]